ncbi:MAG: hypothetical protein KU38_01075 [Sulfurovum sp. FS08-3]|nr:MAG: hypothetical protein KU38_01075 [Sulfurovum sp. FS08-3]
MQTLTVNIQDNFVQDFLTILEHYKDKVQLQKDKKLEHDPYFYERQKQLQQDIEEIDNGNVQMISNENFWNDIDTFTASLQK